MRFGYGSLQVVCDNDNRSLGIRWEQKLALDGLRSEDSCPTSRRRPSLKENKESCF